MKIYLGVAIDVNGVARPPIMTDPGPVTHAPIEKIVQLAGMTSSGEIVFLKLSPTGELWS